MRKLFFCIFLLISAAQCLYAQSGMTDDQVIRMIKESKSRLISSANRYKADAKRCRYLPKLED